MHEMTGNPMSRGLRLVAAVVLLAGSATYAQQSTKEPVDFARQVLPILSDNCFVCHGPDAQQEDLVRLDSYEGATRDLGGHRAVDPGALGRSRLIARIHDPVNTMPPRDSGKSLTDAERDILTRWVTQGGRYAKHWAFAPPRKQAPEADGNPIDAFVKAHLREAGATPAPRADRATLARRAALTLTGLPPDDATLDAFMADQGPGSYERLVDRLLATPGYGEHQARYWLDAVRYGDTHGLHLDNKRGIYPYRDWVVRAFNENLPLDDFITWQVAGDLLPEPTLAQQVATGFIRMNPTTAEGGAIPAEFQAKNNFDRTETFGTVMLGMTMTCARCHTHKYDPITQTEYYRLLAFFNSTAEHSMDGNRYDYAPAIRAPDDQDQWDAWVPLETELRSLVDGVTDDAGTLATYAAATTRWKSEGWSMSERVGTDAAAPAEWKPAKGFPGTRPKFALKKDEAVWITCRISAEVDQTLHLVLSGAKGSAAWLDDTDLAAEPTATQGARESTLLLPLLEGDHTLKVKLVGAKKPMGIGVRMTNPWRPLADSKQWGRCSDEQQLTMMADPRGPLAGDPLRERAAKARRSQAELRRRFTTTLVARDLPKPRATRLLERGEYNLPVGETLTPETPQVMGPLPEGAPRNRLSLARWLVSRDNPLVARVLVNRLWQRVFGYGLVRTPEDFGLQGQQPTHPELLDWLAVELQDSGWDMKRMVRLMVTSDTFRQRSAWRQDVDDPENRLLARGPRHRMDAEVVRDVALFTSGLLDPHMGGAGVKPYQPPGLWASLSHPASNTKRYVEDKGEKLYRRSLYVYWKRTSPHPMMTLFDAPSRETSCVARSRTNTPMQSLALLNERQRLEMSRGLAQRLLKGEPTDAARLEKLFRMLACREPSTRERRACERLLDRMRERYRGAEEEAVALLDRSGGVARDKQLDPVELAAWSQVTITVLASDIAIMLF